MSTPYLGSKISLISRLDIRYVGILYTVDSNESTIALAKVRSFGTEDRPTNHPVKARDEVYEYIIFKASDIKDLVVCEGPKQPEPGDVDYDPAIVSVSKPPVRTEQPKSQAPLPASSPSPPPKPKQQASVGKTQYQSSTSQQQPPPYYQKQQAWQQRPDNRFPPQNQQRSFNPQQQQNSGYNNQRQAQNPRSFNRNTVPKEKLKFDNDYDFEKANEQFKEKLDVLADDLDKVELTAEIEEPNSTDDNDDEKDLAEPCYDKKSSFFDTISCEALEKAGGRTNRPDWRKERQTNNDTFGSSNVRSYNYHNYSNYRNRFNPGGFRGNRQQGSGENRYPQQEGGENQNRYQQHPQHLNSFNPQQGSNRGQPRYQNNRDQVNQPQNRDNSRQQRAYF